MALILRNFYPLTLFLGRHFSGLFGYTERDMELLHPVKEKVFFSIMRESGYLHIQATKPDTVGECSGGDPARGLLHRGQGKAASIIPCTPSAGARAALGGLHHTSVLTASSLVPGLSCSLPRSLLPPPGCALNDSPVGLAAYILEKFSTWTNSEFRDLEDGGLER